MLSWDELKSRRDLVSQIDWDLTPQEAFERYQIKSINAWRHGDPADAYYFLIEVWHGRADLKLVRRTVRDSEEICRPPAPNSLVRSSVEAEGGPSPPGGHYGLGDALSVWLQTELDV